MHILFLLVITLYNSIYTMESQLTKEKPLQQLPSFHQFEQLPAEIQEHILSFIPVEKIPAAHSVSKKFNIMLYREKVLEELLKNAAESAPRYYEKVYQLAWGYFIKNVLQDKNIEVEKNLLVQEYLKTKNETLCILDAHYIKKWDEPFTSPWEKYKHERAKRLESATWTLEKLLRLFILNFIKTKSNARLTANSPYQANKQFKEIMGADIIGNHRVFYKDIILENVFSFFVKVQFAKRVIVDAICKKHEHAHYTKEDGIDILCVFAQQLSKDENVDDAPYKTLLLSCCANEGLLDIFKQLHGLWPVHANKFLTTILYSGNYPLHCAVHYNQDAVVKYILDTNTQTPAIINHSNQKFFTPLQIACDKENLQIISLLLPRSDQPNIIKAFNHCLRSNKIVAANYILDQYVKPNSLLPLFFPPDIWMYVNSIEIFNLIATYRESDEISFKALLKKFVPRTFIKMNMNSPARIKSLVSDAKNIVQAILDKMPSLANELAELEKNGNKTS